MDCEVLFGRLTLLFGFRRHGHVVEFIDESHAVDREETLVRPQRDTRLHRPTEGNQKTGDLQVVHHGRGGARPLRFAVQRDGLHQVVHGGTCDQGLQGLRGRSQGAQQYAGKRPTTSSSCVFKFVRRF